MLQFCKWHFIDSLNLNIEHTVATVCVWKCHITINHLRIPLLIYLWRSICSGDKCVDTNRFISVWNVQRKKMVKSRLPFRAIERNVSLNFQWWNALHKMPLNKQKKHMCWWYFHVGNQQNTIYGKWKRKMQTILFAKAVHHFFWVWIYFVLHFFSSLFAVTCECNGKSK